MEFNRACFMMAILLAFNIVGMTYASDPDILSDFVLPAGQNNNVDGSFFTFTGLQQVRGNNVTGMSNAKVTKASMAEFPALTGLGVSMAVLQFAAGAVNPPHTHPRASELLYLTTGSLQVGVVDTTGKLLTQTLYAGDLFVFPKGLLHFQLNNDKYNHAFAISAFGSANAGTVSMPSALFTSGITSDVLAKSFKTDAKTIDMLKASLKA